jgi:tRNA modification GTPase
MAASATIAAIASPRGPGARGVIRVSGPAARALLEAVWVEGELVPPGRRGASLGRIDDGGGTQPALALWMPGPRSFTREDVVELHLVGAPPLLEAALGRLLTLGARAAEPGEFTRRAFEHGRIDLSRAEGILELVHARSEAERRAATALLLGGLADRLEPLRAELDALRALAEASLDFDEADTGHVPEEELDARSAALLAGLREAASWEERRLLRSHRPRVVLVGEPNAGKSSLLNALAPGAEALVSDLSGTTRDSVHGLWPVPGGELDLVDTAGLDAAAAGPDAEAQRRARDLREGADLLLLLVDPGAARPEHLEATLALLPPGPPLLVAWSKRDLGASPPTLPPSVAARAAGVLAVSARSGAGLGELAARAGELLLDAGASPRPERELGVRHRVALERAATALERGRSAWRAGLSLDLYAEALREVGAELDSISGRTTPEDLLTRIFAAFCIGK